jgi:hypothetical protein
MRPKLSVGALVGLLSLGASAQCGAQSDPCSTSKPLDVGDKNVIAAPRKDRMLALINFAGTLPTVPKADQTCVVIATARKTAGYILSQPRSQEFNTIEIIVALVENMDEYARPDYSGMKQLGRLTFERVGAGMELRKQTLNLDR